MEVEGGVFGLHFRLGCFGGHVMARLFLACNILLVSQRCFFWLDTMVSFGCLLGLNILGIFWTLCFLATLHETLALGLGFTFSRKQKLWMQFSSDLSTHKSDVC